MNESYYKVEIGCPTGKSQQGKAVTTQFQVQSVLIPIPPKGTTPTVTCRFCGKSTGAKVKSAEQVRNQRWFITLISALATIAAFFYGNIELSIFLALISGYFLLQVFRSKPELKLAKGKHRYWQNGVLISQNISPVKAGIFAIVVIVGMVLTTNGDIRMKQEALYALYGEANVNLCIQPSQLESGTIAFNNSKVAFLEYNNVRVVKTTKYQVPETYRATDQSDLEIIACVVENASIPGTVDDYEGGSTCTPYQRKLTVYLISVEIGKRVKSQSFLGKMGICPDQIRVKVENGKKEILHIPKYGTYPDANKMSQWVVDSITK